MRLGKHMVFVGCVCMALGTAFIVEVWAGCGDDSSGARAGGEFDATADTVPDVVSNADAGNTGDVMSEGSPSGFVNVGDAAIAVPAPSQFPHAVDVAYCTRLEQCCLVPHSQWNQSGTNGCVPTLDSNGGVVGLAGFDTALDSGLVAYDPTAAKTCLEYVNSLNCGTVPATAGELIRNLCFGALKGTLTAGAGPCVDSLECGRGLYCRVASQGTSGTCEPLQAQGKPCQDTASSTDCTYLGNGTPALYCLDPGDGGTSTCQAALPVDAGPCSQPAACQSWTCNYPTCVDSFVFSDPGTPNGTCAAFTVLDGGAQ
jgi:hypothetical protein